MPIATRTDTTFRLEYSVATEIAAPPERVWALLADAAGWPRWNTTVTSLEGHIARGHKLKLRVPISERTFTPTVAELEPGRRMVWRDGAPPMFTGARVFTLTPSAGGGTDFSMVEVFKGLMLPLIKKSLPDFRAPFERFAADLKQAAERR
jgi:hypothetical protein